MEQGHGLLVVFAFISVILQLATVAVVSLVMNRAQRDAVARLLTENLTSQNERIAKHIHEALERVGGKADAAYHEANTVNMKIAELNTQLVEQHKELKDKVSK